MLCTKCMHDVDYKQEHWTCPCGEVNCQHMFACSACRIPVRQALAEYLEVPNLDAMDLEEVGKYRHDIKDKQGEVWDKIKAYANLKWQAMTYRHIGLPNTALGFEKDCDEIYQEIKAYLDW